MKHICRWYIHVAILHTWPKVPHKGLINETIKEDHKWDIQ